MDDIVGSSTGISAFQTCRETVDVDRKFTVTAVSVPELSFKQSFH